MKVKELFQNHVFVFICVYIPTSEVERMLFLNNLNLILQNCSSGELLFLDGTLIVQNKKKQKVTFKHQYGIFSKCFIIPVSFSDHSMVCCSFILNSIKPRRHFNTSLLCENNFEDTFTFFGKTFSHKYFFPIFETVVGFWKSTN